LIYWLIVVSSFRPEVAQFISSGRAADIFSLGALYLEVVALCDGQRLEDCRKFRLDQDGSYQANLPHLDRWFKAFSEASNGILVIIKGMLSLEPDKRPTAEQVKIRLAANARLMARRSVLHTPYDLRYHGTCCRPVNIGAANQDLPEDEDHVDEAG
jgi:hypothetical protein